MFLVFVFYTCIDPYSPNLKESESLLVVDGLLTDENISYQVKLSRTYSEQYSDPVMVSGALVSIRDNNGNEYPLNERTEGVYKTDSLTFRGTPGMSYTLHIKTSEGSEYESESCFMYPVEPIDTVYYSKDQEITNNGSEIQEGIRIFLGTEGSADNKYFRWTYNEWWKINAPDPKKYDYINDSTIVPVDQIKQICWGNNKSDEIIIQSIETSLTNRIDNKEILFIPTANSTKMLIKYCFEINQLSISKKEYEFWNHMQQINESGGDIFEKQPFPIVSNIHNINDQDESVLGYFQVSSVKQKRIYITPDDLSALNVSLYNYDCDRIELGPSDFPPSETPGGGMTFDRLYRIYVGEIYSFVEPIYKAEKIDEVYVLKLYKLAFAKKACTDCTINGTLSKPDFWIE